MIPKDKLKVLVVEVFRLWRKNKKDPNQSELPLQSQPSSTKSQQLSFGLGDKDISKLPMGQLSLDVPHKYLSIKDLNKRMESLPFYTDPVKWRKDNFVGGIENRRGEWENDTDNPITYVGPDLSKHGFVISSQKIKPGNIVSTPNLLISNLNGYMNFWNDCLAGKMGFKKSRNYI